MFGKGRDSKPQAHIDSLIGAGTVVEGNIRFSGGLRVDGVIKGEVEAAEGVYGAVLVLSEHARVEGAIRVAHLITNGEVLGPVVVAETLEMQPKAKIIGDVTYALIEMHQGAVIEGRLNHSDGKAVELKLAASN